MKYVTYLSVYPSLHLFHQSLYSSSFFLPSLSIHPSIHLHIPIYSSIARHSGDDLCEGVTWSEGVGIERQADRDVSR